MSIDALEKACEEGGQPLDLRWREGYDHGFYFILTFVQGHMEHHAEVLNAA